MRTKKKLEKLKTENKNGVVAAYIHGLYSRSAPLLICEALLFAACGIFMLFRPMTILTFMTYVIGVALILIGLWRAIAGFVSTRGMGAIMDVLFGLFNIILGVLFCIYPTDSIMGLSYVFVILFFFKALRILVFALNMARARLGHYIFNLILALALTGLAGALFVFPLATAVAIVYYLAIALLLYAASDIYMFLELLKLKRIADR